MKFDSFQQIVWVIFIKFVALVKGKAKLLLINK